jgi:hypothetical protein
MIIVNFTLPDPWPYNQRLLLLRPVNSRVRRGPQNKQKSTNGSSAVSLFVFSDIISPKKAKTPKTTTPKKKAWKNPEDEKVDKIYSR